MQPLDGPLQLLVLVANLAQGGALDRGDGSGPGRPGRSLLADLAACDQPGQADTALLAHHNGAGGQVAEALAAAVEEEHHQPDPVQDGEEVDQPHQVAYQGLDEADRLPPIAHHPEAKYFSTVPLR